jgi:hypothetical protein
MEGESRPFKINNLGPSALMMDMDYRLTRYASPSHHGPHGYGSARYSRPGDIESGRHLTSRAVVGQEDPSVPGVLRFPAATDEWRVGYIPGLPSVKFYYRKWTEGCISFTLYVDGKYQCSGSDVGATFSHGKYTFTLETDAITMHI